MDIKEIAKRIRKTNNSYMLSMSPDIAAEFAEAIIESYKEGLLKEVGEPVYQVCKSDSVSLSAAWIDVTEQTYNDAGLYPEYGRRILYTSDKLAAAQEENGRLENQVLARDAELWGRTQEILGLKDQLAKAEQQTKELSDSVAQKVAEACSAYMLNKNYNSLEFDRKYSAKEFCAGQKSTVEFLAKMIRSGEWRKFLKEGEWDGYWILQQMSKVR